MMTQDDKSDVVISNSETVAPRENLVNTAAKFLQNPRVRQSTLEQRKAFLEKKGLTFEEINLAIEKAGVTEEKILLLPPVEHVVVQSPSVPFHSFWSIFAGITALGGLSFGFYKFFKIYISPYFVDRVKEQEQLEKLDNSIRDLSLSMKQTLEQMQETLKSLQDVQQGKNTMGDIRSELNTIKGLMLSRYEFNLRSHFPPTPSATSLIPSWQLESSTTKLAVSTTSAISSAEIVDSSDISPVSSSSQSSSPPNNDSPGKKTGSDDDTEVINHGDIPESHLTDDNGRTSQ